MNPSHRQLRPFAAAASLPSLSRAAEACHPSQPAFSRALRDIVWPRASHIVWLNFSRESGAFGPLQWHELRTPAEADRFLVSGPQH